MFHSIVFEQVITEVLRLQPVGDGVEQEPVPAIVELGVELINQPQQLPKEKGMSRLTLGIAAIKLAALLSAMRTCCSAVGSSLPETTLQPTSLLRDDEVLGFRSADLHRQLEHTKRRAFCLYNQAQIRKTAPTAHGISLCAPLSIFFDHADH